MNHLGTVNLTDVGCGFMIMKRAALEKLIDDKTAAIVNLKKAIDNGFENYDYLKHDPDLYSLQKESDFIALLKGK